MLQDYLALRRHFKHKKVDLPPMQEVLEVFRGLIRRIIAQEGGVQSLKPKRVEPITPVIVEKMLSVRDIPVAGVTWRPVEDWTPFIITAWCVANLPIGSRRAESVLLPGDTGPSDYFTRADLSWQIGGRVLRDPSDAQLAQLRRGDFARLEPGLAKCDRDGSTHGTDPIVLPYHDNPMNAAWQLAKIETRWPCHGVQRATLPLFCDSQGNAFRADKFSRLVNGLITAVVGADRARLYSTHSWRVFVATGLRLVDAPERISLGFGRWLNPASLRIYARITTSEYAHWVDKLMSVRHIDAARTTNLGVLDESSYLSDWQDALSHKSSDLTTADPLPAKQQRIAIYWHDDEVGDGSVDGTWYTGTVKSHRKTGGGAVETHVMYDPVGEWKTHRDLSYWHVLDEETWEHDTVEMA